MGVIQPKFGPNVYLAPTAYVAGDLVMGADCTVMHHVVIRADVSAIRIGARVNVQDGTVIHTQTDVALEIEDDVGIGHRAVVHCRRVRSNSLIGIGSIVLDGAEIGHWSIVGAGAVVPPGMIVPDGKLVLGVPAKIVRDTTPAEREYIRFVVENYVRLNRRHAAGEFPNAVAKAFAGG
jgi:carbonic anhydrase/acetyltransferase-like protein (isoleucine patch superfamily)